MKQKISLGSITKHVKTFFDYDKEKCELTPYRDWMISMFIFVVINCMSAFVGYTTFLAVNKEDFFETQAIDIRELKPIDAQKLGNLLKILKERENQFRQVRNTSI